MLSVNDLKTKEPESKEIQTLTKALHGKIEGVVTDDPGRQKLLHEINALQNSIEILKKYQTKLENDAIALDQFSFIGKANKLLLEVKKLESFSGQMGRVSINTIPNIPGVREHENAADQPAKSAIYQRVETEIKGILAGTIADLESQKKAIEDDIKATLITDLDKIIGKELKLWNDDTTLPAMMTKASYESFKGGLEEVAAKVKEFKRDPSIVTNAEVLEIRERFENLYTDRRENLKDIASNSEIDVDRIEKRILKLEAEIDHGDLGKSIEPIEKMAGEIAHQLDDAEALLEKNKEMKDLKENDYKMYKEHKENINKMRETLKKASHLGADSKKLLDDNTSLFTENPMDASLMPKGLKNQADFIRKIKDPYRKKMYENFLNEAVSQAEHALSAEKFENHKTKELPKMKKSIQDYLESFQPDKGEYSKTEWHFVSWYDLTRGYEIIKSWTENRMHRNSDMRVGKVGEKIIPNLHIPLTETLTGEFANKAHEAEHHEVDRLIGLYKPHDIFHLRHMLHDGITHVDQLKAVISILCERGAMRWDDPNLLKLFNQFQKRIIFNTTDPEKEFSELSKFNSRIREACNTLWTPDDFRNWQSQNNSAYESGKQKFLNRCNEISETTGLKTELKKMLKEVREDPHHHHVDAMEYEEMIDYACDKGKMGPKDRLYYIFQGMDTGLLDRKRGSELDGKYLNHVPPLEFFAGGRAVTLKDVKIFAKIDAHLYEPGPAFTHIFQSEIMNIPDIKQRLEKVVSKGSPPLDHDDFTAYGAYLEDTTLDTLLKLRADGAPLPNTGYMNITASMLNYVDMLAHSYDKIPDHERELSRFLASFINFDNTTRGRKFAKSHGQYFTWGATGLDTQEPRASGSAYRGSKYSLTARGYIDKVKSLIQDLDPVFFEFIYKETIPDDTKVKEFVAKLQAKYPGQKIFGDQQLPENYDSLLTVSGAYLNFIVKNNGAKVEAMLQKIRKDQEKDSAAESVTKFKTAMARAEYRRDLQVEENLSEGHGHGHGHDDHGGAHGGHGHDDHGGGHGGGHGHARKYWGLEVDPDWKKDPWPEDAHGHGH